MRRQIARRRDCFHPAKDDHLRLSARAPSTYRRAHLRDREPSRLRPCRSRSNKSDQVADRGERFEQPGEDLLRRVRDQKSWPRIFADERGSDSRSSVYIGGHFIPVGDHLVRTTKHWTRARTVSLPDQTFAFHHVEDRGGAPVTDAQTPLEHRRRSALHLDADTQRFFEKLVVFAVRRFQSE